MRSPEALQVKKFRMPSFPEDKRLLECDWSELTKMHFPSLEFYALVVGIDLADLGYQPGALVDGLFLQDDAGDARRVDPVLIAGLPSLGE